MAPQVHQEASPYSDHKTMAFEKLIPQIMQQPQLMLQAAIAAQQAANQRKQFAIQNSSNIGNALLKGWQMYQTGEQQKVENLRADEMMGMKRDQFGFEKEKHGTEMDFKERELTQVTIPKAQAAIDAAEAAGLLSRAQAEEVNVLLGSRAKKAGAEAIVAEAGADVAKETAELGLEQQQTAHKLKLIELGYAENTAVAMTNEYFDKRDREKEAHDSKMETEDQTRKLNQDMLIFNQQKHLDDQNYKSALISIEHDKNLILSGQKVAKDHKEALDSLQGQLKFWDGVASKPIKEGEGGLWAMEGLTDSQGQAKAKEVANYYRDKLKAYTDKKTRLNNQILQTILAGAPRWNTTPTPGDGSTLGNGTDVVTPGGTPGVVIEEDAPWK